MKKAISIILALVMVFGLSSVVLAASDSLEVKNMTLMNRYGFNPGAPTMVEKFKIDRSTGVATVYTQMKKPWITVALDKIHSDSYVDLYDAKGNKIKWRRVATSSSGEKHFATQLSIDDTSRQFKLILTPANGDKSKRVTYKLYVNPGPPKPTGLRAIASTKSDSITLTWNRCINATGYKIQRSENQSGGFAEIKMLKSANTLRFNDKNLVSSKTYFYKIIPYHLLNGQIVNGTASNIVSATVR